MASPEQVVAGADAAVAALTAVVVPSGVAGSRSQWAGVVGSLQRVIDVASAVQDAAIVRLAAIEAEYLEDGTEVECHRGLGHVALDAPAILSGVLAVSAVHAERRVAGAVSLAADGPPGSAGESGLGGLHAAMGSGRLDAYRAGVIAQELEAAPPQVRASVVALLQRHFEVEDAAHLRRRCRRALARISPDLLRQRALRARAACGLRRWVDEPGVDRWEGTFPSEDAARAWAAIDALARRYVTDGACATIEGARGKALTDLVAGNATIDTMLTLTVPATAIPSEAREGSDERPGRGHRPRGQPAGSGLPNLAHPAGRAPRSRFEHRPTAATVQVAPCHPDTGALLDPDGGADAYRPSARLARRVRARDRRCRFPGCTVAAVFCDLDHVRPWPAGPTDDTNLVCLCRRHHRVKQRPGWHAVLAADATLTWTDPTGRVRTTHPADALTSTILTSTVLTGMPPPATETSTSRPRTDPPDGPHSDLEFQHEHRAAAAPSRDRHPPWWDQRGGRHRAELHPSTAAVLVGPTADWPHRRGRDGRRSRDHDPPPF